MKKIIFTLILALSFVNCTQNNQIRRNETPKINLQDVASDTAYKLINLYPGDDMTFGIDSDGRIYGYSGMNRFFGKANVYNGHIVITELLTTKININRDAFIKEEVYLSLLNSMTNIEFKHDRLILSNDSHQTLEFIR